MITGLVHGRFQRYTDGLRSGSSGTANRFGRDPNTAVLTTDALAAQMRQRPARGRPGAQVSRAGGCSSLGEAGQHHLPRSLSLSPPPRVRWHFRASPRASHSSQGTAAALGPAVFPPPPLIVQPIRLQLWPQNLLPVAPQPPGCPALFH